MKFRKRRVKFLTIRRSLNASQDDQKYKDIP